MKWCLYVFTIAMVCSADSYVLKANSHTIIANDTVRLTAPDGTVTIYCTVLDSMLKASGFFKARFTQSGTLAVINTALVGNFLEIKTTSVTTDQEGFVTAVPENASIVLPVNKFYLKIKGIVPVRNPIIISTHRIGRPEARQSATLQGKNLTANRPHANQQVLSSEGKGAVLK